MSTIEQYTLYNRMVLYIHISYCADLYGQTFQIQITNGRYIVSLTSFATE